MDIFTQGLLGATVAQAGARPEDIRKATYIGFLSGLLADADALIKSAQDPLLTLEFHRHFSHSLFFIPFGALIAALVLWPFFKRRLSFARLYLYSFLGYALSGVLDACTSYGTSLLWPISDARLAWSIVSIVDPVFSLCLIIALIIGWKKLASTAAKAGLLCVIAYLTLGFLQHEQALELAKQTAIQRGHFAERFIVKPTMANQLVWRSIYESKGIFYVDAIRISYFSDNKIYEGGQIRKFNPETDTEQLQNRPIIINDIKRFQKFSDDFITRSPISNTIIGDIRYSMLPTGLNPLWGIELDVEQGNHVQFENYRDTSQATREKFVNMLLGR